MAIEGRTPLARFCMATITPPTREDASDHGRQARMNFEFREGNPATTSAAQVDVGYKNASTKPVATSKKLDEAGARLAAELNVFHQVAGELKAKCVPDAPMADRCRQVLSTATELFGVAPTWTAFYREVLGVDGVARKLFCDAEDMCAYECSEEHSKVLEMLTVLRSRDLPDCDPNEAQRMITVRIPKSLHDSICKEANDLQVSVKKLCITRLVQRVDRGQIPTSAQKRRGRRPGAEYARPAAMASISLPTHGTQVDEHQ